MNPLTRFHALRIVRIERQTRDAIEVVFDIPHALRDTFCHIQGQHVTVRATIGEEEVRRSYSICSAVGEADLRIAIKRVHEGQFSSWAHETLRPGSTLEVMPPTGQFHHPLDPTAKHRYIAFAAGSGITPIISILKTTLQAEPASRFILVYGNRSSSSVMFREELQDLKDRYLERLNLVHILSREQQDMELFNGHIDHAKVVALFERWIDPGAIDRAFVCGPSGMMEAVRDALVEYGLDRSQVKMELFSGSAPARAPRPDPLSGPTDLSQITIVQDAQRRSFRMNRNAQSILEAALAEGIDLPYSCKAGVCSTCRAKRTAGETELYANYALEDYELARGFVLTCQSYPISDLVVLDYDQEN